MSETIDETRVRHMARLARLALSETEVQLYAGQLGRILDYVQQLQAVDTRGVEPLAHPLPLTDVVRDDQPGPTLGDLALVNAPQREARFFKVPPVLDGGA